MSKPFITRYGNSLGAAAVSILFLALFAPALEGQLTVAGVASGVGLVGFIILSQLIGYFLDVQLSEE